MASTTILDIISYWKEFGVFDFLIPFFIMFSVTWAILQKIKLFGDPYYEKDASKKRQREAKLARFVNFVVSFGASMYIMANIGIGVDFASFLYGLFATSFMIIGSIIASVVVLMIGYAVVTSKDPLKDPDNIPNEWKYLAAGTIILSIMMSVYIYFYNTGIIESPGLINIEFSPMGIDMGRSLRPYLIGIDVFGGFLWALIILSLVYASSRVIKAFSEYMLGIEITLAKAIVISSVLWTILMTLFMS